MNHLTSEMLHEYLDNLNEGKTRVQIELHIETCEICSGKLKLLRTIDSALNRMKRESVDAGFTQRIMNQLEIKESSTIVWSIFKNLAPLLGLVVIISIIYGVLKYTGKLEGSGVGDTISATQSVYDSASGEISKGISSFTGWMKNLFPFLYTKGSYSLAAFLIVFFIIVALLDKFIFMPIVRRKM
jgi:hypothetical protein